ncbi:hypothetical protein MMC21_005283 [Puttea exsequens]|nr:hypothetical protein [Puttea exsequens]
MPDPSKQLGLHPYGARGPEILIVTWIETAVALVVMGARLYVNTRLLNRIRSDFWWALITLVVSLFGQIALTVSVRWGIGNHSDVLRPDQVQHAIEWSWIGQIVTLLSTGFGKIAIIAFLLRIQEGTHKYKGWFLHFVGWSNMVLNIIQVILILLQCSPTPKLWNNNLPGTCEHRIRTNKAGYFRGSYSALGDLILAIYPIVVFWNLQMSKKLKIGLCLLMSGGVIATACAIVKTVYIELISKTEDRTYVLTPLLLWAYSEMWAILILGSIPPIRPLFIRGFRRLYHPNKTNEFSSFSDRERSFSRGIPLEPLSHVATGGKGGASHFSRSGTMRSESVEKILPWQGGESGEGGGGGEGAGAGVGGGRGADPPVKGIWATTSINVRQGSQKESLDKGMSETRTAAYTNNR